MQPGVCANSLHTKTKLELTHGFNVHVAHHEHPFKEYLLHIYCIMVINSSMFQVFQAAFRRFVLYILTVDT